MTGPDAARVLADAERICLVAAPTFAESERGALVAQLLREAGGSPELDDVGDVLCRFGGPGPAIVLAAHLDTVFAAPTTLQVVRHGDRVAAPGIGDNSLGVAALAHLARRLAAAPPRRPVVLAATVGEEGLGDLRGAAHVVDTVACTCFIAIEGQSLHSLEHAGIGSTRYRVTYSGAGGHPWGDRGTPSAVHGLIRQADRLLAWAEDRRAIDSERDLVVNVGRIEGGSTINTIAAEAMLELDLRSRDPEALEAVSRRAQELFGQPPEGLTAIVQRVGRRPSGGIGRDHPLLAAARRARTRAGLRAADEGASSTDANAAYGRGIPAITVGVSTGDNAHRLDEYIDVEPIAAGLRALELLVSLLADGPDVVGEVSEVGEVDAPAPDGADAAPQTAPADDQSRGADGP